MPYGYNSLNDLEINVYEIGICPICSVRLTHGCEHSNTQAAQEWLAAQIVAEQELDGDKWTFEFERQLEESKRISQWLDDEPMMSEENQLRSELLG